MLIALRPAGPGDIDMLDAMHTLCMRPHVERVYPWKPELFRETFDPSAAEVITVDGADAGMLTLAGEPGAILLRTIIIFPEFQGRGIGSVVIGRLLERAGARGVPVRLQVLKGNPARGLYERLGFRAVDETPTHHIMVSEGRGDRPGGRR